MFTGLWLPLITPFRNGQIDHAALQRLVEHYASTGLAGFVACGSTGEAAALDEAEQISVLETILGACKGLPVVMGLSGYHLGQTQAWVRRLADFDLAGLLVPAPHYIRPPALGHIAGSHCGDVCRAKSDLHQGGFGQRRLDKQRTPCTHAKRLNAAC
jgi:4-hydroxy-tetrahydrodipicolinate synthase